MDQARTIRTLPVARHLKTMPKFFGYTGVAEWVDYENMDEEQDQYALDEDALLLDERREEGLNRKGVQKASQLL